MHINFKKSDGPFVHDPSLTEAFEALPAHAVSERSIKAVVVGGGTGAPVSIRTLLSMGIETSCVVAMADDGGSSGILRDEAGASTPGDVRKCLSAMAACPTDAFTQAFRLRFTFAENHTLGNLMLSALEQTTGSFPTAIKTCAQLLHARGNVYPSTLERVTLLARNNEGRLLRGQALASHSRSALNTVSLESPDTLQAYEPALDALRSANLIVLGPGSLFTSIIANLLVPGVVDAIRASSANVVFVCSLADIQGETRGMSVLEHVEALLRFGLEGRLDWVIVHTPHHEKTPVVWDDTQQEALREKGISVCARRLIDDALPTWHDPRLLREAFEEVLRACHLQPTLK